MNSNLIPQKRLNKNGVLVTKYVRDDTGNSRGSKPIPAPSSPASPSHEMKINFLHEEIRYNHEEYFEAMDDKALPYEEITHRIEMLENGVIDAYYETITGNPGKGFEDILISAMHNNISSSEAGSVLFIARMEEHLDLEWSRYRGGVFSYGDARSLHAGLSHYEPDVSFPPNLLDATKEDQEKATVLVNAVNGILEHDLEVDSDGNELLLDSAHYGGGFRAFEDTDLADVFLDYPDQTSEILDIIQTRNTSDPEAIRAVLSAEATAVREGIL